MKLLLRWTVLLLAWTAFSCNEHDFYKVNTKQETTEVVAELERGEANILWVLDTSGSMDWMLQSVRRNAASFTDLLEKMNVPFTLGMVESENNGVGSKTDYGSIGILRGSPKVLSHRVPNWKNLFVDRVPTSTWGGSEQLLLPIWAVFDPGRLANENAGFVTPNGTLVIIVITDTDDQSRDVEPTDILSRVSSFYKPNRIFYFGVVCIDNHSNCESDWNKSNHSANELYYFKDLLPNPSAQSLMFPFSEPNYSKHLTKMADVIVKFLTRYTLKQKPVLSTLKVLINGVEIPADFENGWSYNPSENSITFHGSAAPKSGDDKIEVRFKPAIIK